MVQMAFEEGKIPMAFKRGILKLIPKPGSKGLRGIALLESIYKLLSMIIHIRLMDTVDFHDSVHGFRRHRGTSTAIINLKLQMQLAKREKSHYIWFSLTSKRLMIRWTGRGQFGCYKIMGWDKIRFDY